jgi:hypothetical protein
MLPVVSALQAVVAVQVIQTLALAVAVLYILRRFASDQAESRRRAQEREESLASELRRLVAERAEDRRQANEREASIATELRKLEGTVRAARAETATFLPSIFAGVQGIARNLDATRSSTAEALDQLRPKPAEPPPMPPQAAEDQAPGAHRTIEEPRPAELLKLRNAGAAGRR